jgi:hypothetical protein
MPEIDMDRMKSIVDALEKNEADRKGLLSQLYDTVGVKPSKKLRQAIDNKRTHAALQLLLHKPS